MLRNMRQAVWKNVCSVFPFPATHHGLLENDSVPLFFLLFTSCQLHCRFRPWELLRLDYKIPFKIIRGRDFNSNYDGSWNNSYRNGYGI